MIRKIITPQERTYVLELPEDFVGKEIEVLAFEVEEGLVKSEGDSVKLSVETLFSRFEGLTFDSKGTYTFDRSEATDYE